jgi:hypothetical protein
MLHAIRTGKIRAGEAGVSRPWRALAARIGMDVGLLVIRTGGGCETPPFIEVP